MDPRTVETLMSGIPLARRRLLQLGGLGAVGLTLPRLLAADEISNRSERSCLFIFLNGGPSHLETFDPKPDAPSEIRGQYKPIATSAPGVYLSEMLPKMARLADRYTLVRTLSHGELTHVKATHMCLSGQSDGSSENHTPYFGSVMAKVRPSTANVPSYVWLHNLLVGTHKPGRQESGGVLGAAYAPLRIGRDLDNPSNPEFRVRVFDPPSGVSRQTVVDRRRLLERLEPPTEATLRTAAGSDFRRLQERAVDLVTGSDTRAAFDVTLEPDRVRDRYGRHQLGQYLLLARRLIEAGVRLVGVTGCPGSPPGEVDPPIRQVWDAHDSYYVGNDNMYGTGMYGLGAHLPRLDQAFSALMEDLDDRGLLDTTLVVLVGEFGRTPQFEGLGRGRGHWFPCYTGLLAGCGIRRGGVYGSSDKIGAFVAQGQPIPPEDFGATIYHALGVPPETRPDPNNLGLRVSAGRPVLDLFA